VQGDGRIDGNFGNNTAIRIGALVQDESDGKWLASIIVGEAKVEEQIDGAVS
jgi:hypothetical protein